ncbi:hypothetical protein RCH14_004464 [Massilia sp. MP_M2]|uniref:hypothetical protein n=1 Tax=Massilia sp. MP_M2 TaxID=3071713 RepID=UPI00319DC8B8
MRFNLILTAIALAFCVTSLQAQQLTPDRPPVVPGNNMPGQALAVTPTAVASPATAPAVSTPGAVTLSDIARQGSATPAPTVQPQSAGQVPAIAILDGNSNKIATKPVPVPTVVRVAPDTSISLSRISRVGFDTTVVLWVKGQNRRVTTGSRVLDYTIGEIRDDGVCLYKPQTAAQIKKKQVASENRCKPFLTFAKGL